MRGDARCASERACEPRRRRGGSPSREFAGQNAPRGYELNPCYLKEQNVRLRASVRIRDLRIRRVPVERRRKIVASAASVARGLNLNATGDRPRSLSRPLNQALIPSANGANGKRDSQLFAMFSSIYTVPRPSPQFTGFTVVLMTRLNLRKLNRGFNANLTSSLRHLPSDTEVPKGWEGFSRMWEISLHTFFA